jgi:hypothetical protein
MQAILKAAHTSTERSHELTLQSHELTNEINKILQSTNEETKASLQLAKQTRRLSEEMMKDSVYMKTIALLTVLFLPGISFAVSNITPNNPPHCPCPPDSELRRQYSLCHSLVRMGGCRMRVGYASGLRLQSQRLRCASRFMWFGARRKREGRKRCRMRMRRYNSTQCYFLGLSTVDGAKLLFYLMCSCLQANKFICCYSRPVYSLESHHATKLLCSYITSRNSANY